MSKSLNLKSNPIVRSLFVIDYSLDKIKKNEMIIKVKIVKN